VTTWTKARSRYPERYRNALVADPELMKAAVRAVVELHYHDLLMQEGRAPPTSSETH
jgi:hypothetical protein